MSFFIYLMIFGCELMTNKDSLGEYSWVSGLVFSIGAIGCMACHMHHRDRIEKLEIRVKKLEEKDKNI